MAPPLFRTNLQAAGANTTRPQVRQTRRFDRSTASGRVGGSTARPASGRTFALRPTPGFQSRLKSTRVECPKSTQKPLDRKRSSFGSTTDSRFSKSTPGFSESTRLKSTPTACLGVDSGPCHAGATLVPRWCHAGTTLVPRWCHAGATLVPRW